MNRLGKPLAKLWVLPTPNHKMSFHGLGPLSPVHDRTSGFRSDQWSQSWELMEAPLSRGKEMTAYRAAVGMAAYCTAELCPKLRLCEEGPGSRSAMHCSMVGMPEVAVSPALPVTVEVSVQSELVSGSGAAPSW